MTKNEYFYVLETILIKASNENAMDTHKFVMSEIAKLPEDCKCYFVQSNDESICCTDKKMATDLWNANPTFTEMYYCDKYGSCYTIKTRK